MSAPPAMSWSVREVAGVREMLRPHPVWSPLNNRRVHLAGREIRRSHPIWASLVEPGTAARPPHPTSTCPDITGGGVFAAGPPIAGSFFACHS